MKLGFLSGKHVSRLREQAELNMSKYGTPISWVDTFAGGKTYLHESAFIVDPPPLLIISKEDNASNDAENAKRIYSWLGKLKPAVAMEERLWAHLTHHVFQDYMAARWPVDGASAIHRRYLLEGKTFAALSRNGISRLWWAGYLTKDEKRPNPFELTEVLFLRQDIQVSLLERAIGKCANVRTGVLDFLKDNRAWLGEEAFGKRIQLILKELNLLGGVVILDALPESELRAVLARLGHKLVKSTESIATLPK